MVTFAEAVSSYLASVPKNLEFPLGGEVAIPTPAEVELLTRIQHSKLTTDDIGSVRTQLKRMQGYDLAIFGIRMAVLGARSKSVPMLRAGAVGLIVDPDIVDSRDLLVGFSIVEDCANRLGSELAEVMNDALALATDRRRQLLEGYCSRSPEMRGLKVMRVAVSGDGENLTYSVIPW